MTMCVMQVPQERLLGQRILQKGHKVKSEEDRCYCDPLLDLLQHLGKMEVAKEHVSIAAYANTYTYMCTVLNYPSLSV